VIRINPTAYTRIVGMRMLQCSSKARVTGEYRRSRATRNCGARVMSPFSLQEIVEFRVLSHESADERALRDDFKALRAHTLERAAHKRGADASTGQFGWDLGMREGDDAGRHSIIGDRRMAVRDELEAVQRGVVSHDVRHGCFQRSHYARDNYGAASRDDENRPLPPDVKPHWRAWLDTGTA
jgi:hypothetical protein